MRCLALLALLAAAPAFADDDPSQTMPIAVTARLDGETAVLALRYRISVQGPMLSRAAAVLVLPPGAIATGATATIGGVRQRLALMPRPDVDAALDALGGIDAGTLGTAVAIQSDFS